MSDPIKLSIHHKKKRNMGQIICSTLTSVTKVLIVQPFDFLRYRIQTSFKTQYHLTSVIKRMSTMEGLNIFLKASTVTATGIFISSFSVFFFYQKGKDFFLNRFYYKNDPICHENRFKLNDCDFNNCEEKRKLYKPKLWKIASLSSLGGIVAGIFTTIITLPTDNVRIRIQSMQNIKKVELHSYYYDRPRDTIIDTYKRSGIKGFYVATGVSMARECIAGIVYFGSFEYLKDRKKINQIKIENKDKIETINHLPIYYTFLYGSMAGALNWTITLPIDHVKTKLISDHILSTQKFKSTYDCIRKTYMEFGLRGFYSGYSVILSRAIIVNGAVITVFEKCKKHHFDH